MWFLSGPRQALWVSDLRGGEYRTHILHLCRCLRKGEFDWVQVVRVPGDVVGIALPAILVASPSIETRYPGDWDAISSDESADAVALARDARQRAAALLQAASGDGDAA